MTPIEKAARALAVELHRQECDEEIAPEAVQFAEGLELSYIDQSSVDMSALVRAVLQAIREPSHDMTAPIVRPGEDRTAAIHIWQAMIDATLNEAT